MNNNYKIIQDEKALLEFIEWLPELKTNEKFYLCLFARKKYAPEGSKLTSDKSQLKRFVADKKFLFSKIKQLECALGSYTTSNGHPVPEESLALYITPNPRDLEKATKNALIKFAHQVTEKTAVFSPQSEILSIIQTSASNKEYLDFDFDGIEPEIVLNAIEGKINKNALTFVKTRGGFHVLVKMGLVENQYKKTWYNTLTSVVGCDIRGDNLLPVIGCVQGGFTPHFISI